jgi:two-component system NtrC family sensor kinase
VSNETILVVDDDPMIADFLAGSLLPALGYHTLVARTGARALELARSQRPELMRLDFQLQTTAGLAPLGQLAQEGYRIPLILITAEGRRPEMCQT